MLDYNLTQVDFSRTTQLSRHFMIHLAISRSGSPFIAETKLNLVTITVIDEDTISNISSDRDKMCHASFNYPLKYGIRCATKSFWKIFIWVYQNYVTFWFGKQVCSAIFLRNASFKLLRTILRSSLYWWMCVQNLMSLSWPRKAVAFACTWTERSDQFMACQKGRIEITVTKQIPVHLGSLPLLHCQVSKTDSNRICVYSGVSDVNYRQFHTFVRLPAQQTCYFDSLRWHSTVMVPLLDLLPLAYW